MPMADNRFFTNNFVKSFGLSPVLSAPYISRRDSEMNIGSVATAGQLAAVQPRAQVPTQTPGADHDNDGDNGSSVKSATTTGVGKNVDVDA